MAKKQAVRIEYWPMRFLTKEQRDALWTLTRSDKPNGSKSLFREWLTKFSHIDLTHAAIVYLDNKIVGWAGACLGTDWNSGTIGVFVHPDFRNQGLAKRALRVLISELKKSYPNWYEYLYYMKDYEQLFRPIIETGGFRDAHLRAHEFCERLGKAMRREKF